MAAKKNKVMFVCASCGASAGKWQGQCPQCGEWNTIVERIGGVRERGRGGGAKAISLSEIDADESPRFSSGMAEFDRVLGGGFVDGGVVLLGGDPGVGKSTLLLQSAAAVAKEGRRALYVSGEESSRQIALRARRLKLSADLGLLTETCAEDIAAAIIAEDARLVVVDSIQTLYSSAFAGGGAGGVVQLRECTALLSRAAKESGAAIVLIGHVTKEGTVAGPRALEHMVDAVIYFEGERGASHRILRAAKNRFGAVNEMAVFAMLDEGLREVANPSRLFLARRRKAVAGAGVAAVREGSRPLLIEIQALVSPAGGGGGRRSAVGLESDRLNLLLAALTRHVGVEWHSHDIFVNAVGGARISEPAADLAVVFAVLSSFYDRPLPSGLAVFGEVGLTGEIRQVPGGQERIAEAAKQGFSRMVIPSANKPRRAIGGMAVSPAENLMEAVGLLREQFDSAAEKNAE